MGLFDKAKNGFNKALDHYKKAKEALPGSDIFLLEISTAASLLQKEIKRRATVSDEYILLANIYYALFILDQNNYHQQDFLFFATSCIYHWKFKRGYTKHRDNAKKVYSLIVSALEIKYPISSTDEIRNNLMHEIYIENFYAALKFNIKESFYSKENNQQNKITIKNQSKRKEENIKNNLPNLNEEERDFFHDYPD